MAWSVPHLQQAFAESEHPRFDRLIRFYRADIPVRAMQPHRYPESFCNLAGGTDVIGVAVGCVDGERRGAVCQLLHAVGVGGRIHNDDPDAADMWMPAGSFWTQPKGEVHITAAKGTDTLAYIEIEEGPYLVLPAEKAFDSGERPVNVDASNIVWVDQPGNPASANGPKVSVLWGNPQDGHLNGTFVKLPAGFTGKINSHGSTFRAVVIKGQPQYQVPGETDVKALEPGSYFSSKGESVHQVSSEAGEESIIYVRTDGKYDVIPAK